MRMGAGATDVALSELLHGGALRRRDMTPSPPLFEGSLAELYARWALPNLPRPDIVAYYHELLVEYCNGEHPLFLVRALSERRTKRGVVYATRAGERFKVGDNSPAWWMHYVLFNELRVTQPVFARMIGGMPTHFHAIQKQVPRSISNAGWYVAHIFRAKDGNVDYANWSRHDLVRRFIRNIHPCNYFFVPKPRARDYGEDPRVIAFFATQYAARYSAVWREFLDLAQHGPPPDGEQFGSLPYSYGTAAPSIGGNPSDQTPTGAAGAPGARDPAEPRAVYSHSRLCFRADRIEPLAPHDTFRIVTRVGIFQLTKAQFYADFPNVRDSASYQTAGIYHYPSPPSRALKYRIAR